MERPQVEIPNLAEQGRGDDGKPIESNRRLFIQLNVFDHCIDPGAAADTFAGSGLTGVVYADVTNPRGIGVLTIAEEPAVFATHLRDVLNRWPFDNLHQRLDMTMFGRTYSLGYESDLNETLVDRPLRHALEPSWPWAIWYPVKRKGEFELLPADEQRSMLMEHGMLGMAFGKGDYAHDIRLVSHGLDRNDADFVVGLTGRELHPLSALVQRMRKTRHTAEYLEKLGPFFVGRVLTQARGETVRH